MAAVLALQPCLMTSSGPGTSSRLLYQPAPAPPPQRPLLPSGIHVLLVDDEKLSRVVVGNLLRKCSYQVTTVDSGEEALKKLRCAKSDTYHLVLTDVMMPVVDGLQVLRFVRNTPELTNLPVVMMSAMEHQDKVFECIKHGAEEYIVKPVTHKEVQNFWQHVCRRLWQTQPQLSHSSQDPSPAQTVAASAAQQASMSQISAQVLENPAASPLPSSIPLPPPPALGPAGLLNPAIHSRVDRSSKLKKVLLSQWLARPSRSVEPKEAFRIFCELLLLVEKAQATQGPVPPLRPSRLHLYSDGRVMFAPPAAHASATAATDDILYLSPEEESSHAPHHPGSASFSLGITFFELFCPLPPHLRTRTLSDLRRRVVPADFLKSHPQEAAFALTLLHPDPACRPSAAELAASDMFRGVCCVLRQRHAALEAQDQLLDAQVLWDFLSTMHGSKHSEVSRVVEELGALDADIAQVASHLTAAGSWAAAAVVETANTAAAAALTVGCKRPIGADAAPLRGQDTQMVDVPGATGKRLCLTGGRHVEVAGGSGCGSKLLETEVGEVVVSRWQKLLAVFPQVETAYFALKRQGGSDAEPRPMQRTLSQLALAASQQRLNPAPCVSAAEPAASAHNSLSRASSAPLPCTTLLQPVATPAAVTMFPTTSMQPSAPVEPPAHATAPAQPQARPLSTSLAAFSEDLGRYAQYSRLDVKASLRYGDLLDTTNMVCSMAFDRDDEFFATAGVNKRIKIFEYATVMDSAAGVHCPLMEINSRSKLSSVCWSGYIKNHLACSDYEGIVQLWDANTNTELMQFEEHDKRVWSVDFSQVDPTRLLSGSDDGTVRLWSINQDCSVATIDTQANVCSVQFSPDSSHLVALASANYNVYLYDLRAPREALATLAGHQKAVSYVRFLDGNMLVSASTDNSLRLWDLASASSGDAAGACRRTFAGHMNEKNFVGLSVTPDGYIACGSETNTVYCYYQALPMPVMSHAFGSADPITGLETDSVDGSQFVSSVCWSQKHQTLLAANSTGSIKLLAMV